MLGSKPAGLFMLKKYIADVVTGVSDLKIGLVLMISEQID